uniref:2-octaprenyl-6-methoxyphenyl hydroxylase n=1 Tax=Candidatus Aschnera chinzeii TaxID=1485666 RepID=A0AAT9G415_9ENTR|nr:MAG: 2-octaprenyl-6-methoxyphenyl hydroxylase [Candidatus Aschnera chinzeii]
MTMKIIIVGGGVIGASLAFAIYKLSNKNIDIVLIEKNLPIYNKLNNNFKTIALSYDTAKFYKTIGLWYKKLDKYVTSIVKINISEGNIGINFNISAINYMIPAFGYVINLQDAQKLIFEEIKTTNIKLLCPNTVVDLIQHVDYISVSLNDGQIINGQLLIAADGTCSTISKLSKISYYSKIYKQNAVTADLITSILPNGIAFEKFTTSGLVTILPKINDRSALIWCYFQDKYYNIYNWDKTLFVTELQKIFGMRLGKLNLIGKPCYYPINLSYANNIIAHRIVLIGNAAQTIHPIAAQGFNLGMRDVSALSYLLIQADNNHIDIGNYSLLMNYQQIRTNDRNHIINFTDNLINIFTKKDLFTLLFRYVGFLTLDTFPVIRDIVFEKIYNNLKKYYV